MKIEEKSTLILGASPNPDRASYEALVSLMQRNVPVTAVGRREYESGGIKIHRSVPPGLKDIHTVALYMSAANQEEFYDFILELNPRRLIFNPGTINPVLADMASFQGIEVVENCLLVMIKRGDF
jgi:hypothetical protein